MNRRAKAALGAGLLIATIVAGMALYARWTFPSDQTPEGAYARIVLAITRGHVRDCFAYLETRAQWACYSTRDFRAQSYARVAEAYPETERTRLMNVYRDEARAPDGADVWVLLAERRGWVARLRGDLSGIKHVEINGERATIETARGTRYPFRRRENGIWGLTLFTAELLEESERAARDHELVTRAADDYARAAKGP